MAKCAQFLDKYEYIIFDMDGVITSEENYWDIAALTVYELLNSSRYYGNEQLDVIDCLNRVKEIRSEVFYNDKIITLVKERGVNSNWDLGYVVFAYMLTKKCESYKAVYDYIKESSLMAFDLYEECARLLADKLNLPVELCRRNETIWNMCRDVFQEWYFGSDEFEVFYNTKPRMPGKLSMEMREVPAIELSDVLAVLKTLKDGGKKLMIATGRSDRDVSNPMALWDIRKYFESDAIATYTHIMNAEENFLKEGKKVILTKPEPYIFLKALYRTTCPDGKIIAGDYDKSLLSKALVVGDAGSDLFAAKRMGCDFLAVLTGVSGEKAKGYFEKENAEYILPSIKEMITY
ncbi:MAG: HAD hydrolase-like protein [Clostridia bacterium]|nr:HAD hydrolase-like protein [Clostridia bacterium]